MGRDTKGVFRDSIEVIWAYNANFLDSLGMLLKLPSECSSLFKV